jgi:drug/metabolite transporter (DMT)-like permease
MWLYLALLSAFFNAVGNIARRTHGSLAHPAELAWWSLLFSAPLSLGLLLVSAHPWYTGTGFILPILIAAVINSAASILQYKAFHDADASLVSPITNLLPALLVVTSFAMLGVRPSLGGLLGIVLVVGGIYYTSVSGKHALFHPFKQLLRNSGSRAMLLTVILWSVSSNLEKIALKTANAALLSTVMIVIMWSIISVYLLLQPQKRRLKRGERVIRKWGWHIVAISVFVTLSVFFQLQAIRLVPNPSYVIAVKRTDVLITVLLAGLLLGEKHILKRFRGSLVALAGIVVIVLAG